MPEEPAQGAEPRRDILKTPPVEAKEMEELIAKGHQAHNVVGALTFIGIIVVALLYLYMNVLDKVGVNEGVEPPPPPRAGTYADHLERLVDDQAARDRSAYLQRRASEASSPTWPVKMYRKLRVDIYIVAGGALLLAIIFLHMEKAKMRRNDLLVYRALAREIEKLRARMKEIEGKRRQGADAAPGKTEDAAG